MRPYLLFPLLALGSLAAACGSATPPRGDREKVLRQAFQEIQIREARLEKHRAALSGGYEGCAAACGEVKALCAQSRAICQIARKAMDSDALARCDRAGRSCRAESGRLSRTCSCGEAMREPGGSAEAGIGRESGADATDE